MKTFEQGELNFVSLKASGKFYYTPQMPKVFAQLIPALDYAKKPSVSLGSSVTADPTQNSHAKPTPKPSVPSHPAPVIEPQKPPTPTVTLEPQKPPAPAVNLEPQKPPAPTVNLDPQKPTIDTTGSTTGNIPNTNVPTVDTTAPLTPSEVGSTLVDAPIANPGADWKPGYQYTSLELLNPSNLAGYIIDQFQKPAPQVSLAGASQEPSGESFSFATSVLNPMHVANQLTLAASDYFTTDPLTPKEPSFFATSMLNPMYVANELTLAASDYFASDTLDAPSTPKEPSFFATSVLNPMHVANQLTLAASDYFKPVTLETVPSLDSTKPAVEVNITGEIAQETVEKQPSFLATSLFNPVNLADSLLSTASNTYHHLFDPKLVTAEEIQGLQTEIATERSFLGEIQAKIGSITNEISETQTTLDKNIKAALNAYLLLEDKNLGMHDLLEKHAPGGVAAKFMEGFSAAWAKVDPEDVTLTFKEITADSSAQDLGWVLKHLEKFDARLGEATDNAITIANQTASKITSTEVTSFEQTQTILAEQKAHLAELDAARQDASLSFNMHNALYQGQSFYDFSQTADYQSTKFSLDQANKAYESAYLDYVTLNKAVDSVLTLQELRATAQNACHACTEIQANLDTLHAENATLYKLQSSEYSVTSSLTKHEKQLTTLEKNFALQEAQQAKELLIVLPEKPNTSALFPEFTQKSLPTKVKLEDVLTKPDFFSEKLSANIMYGSTKHVDCFDTLSDASENAMQAYGKMQLREAQLNDAQLHFEAANDALEVSKAEAANLVNPSFLKHVSFINAWVPGGISSTYFKESTSHHKEMNSVEDALFNRDKAQEIFDQELKFIAQSKNLNLNGDINFESVDAALTERMTLASKAEYTELSLLKHKVGEMSNNIEILNQVVENYKAYEDAQKNFIDSQRNLAEAQVLFENNEAVLLKLHVEKPYALPQGSDALYQVTLPTLDKTAGTEDCFKPIHLEVF